MRFIRNVLVVGLLIIGYMDAKQIGGVKKVVPVEEAPAPVLPAQPVQPTIPEEMPMPQPDISMLPKPMNAPEVVAEKQRQEKKRQERGRKERKAQQPQKQQMNVQDYARNKVTALSTRLIDDIFPKEKSIERMVFEFKDEFPGPNKESDITILYNAIINNPEIKKNITLKNAVSVYNFIKEALSKAWDKKDNLVWSR